MGKKGKKKGKNFSKMSEEQKARYLQQQADAEQEARQRKIQLLALFMKNKLKREAAFSRLNMAKINQNWRSILRQLKCEEQRKEITVMQTIFKEAIERKDRTIARLLNDLDAAEDSYIRMKNGKMEIISKLLGIFQQRTESFRSFYKEQETIILQDHKENCKEFKTLGDQAQEQLECIAFQLEDKREKQLNEQHENYLEKVDDLKATMQLRLENIIESREAQLQNLWHEYQTVLNGYIKRTETFYADYMELKQRDEESTKISLINCNEIEHLNEQLENLKIKYGETKETCDFKVKEMMEKCKDLDDEFARRKREIDVDMRNREEILKIICVESYKILKDLREKQEEGESIVKLAAICRKYEMQSEHIQPLSKIRSSPLSSSSSSSTCWSSNRNSYAPPEEEMKKPPEELKREVPYEIWQKMEKFWQRVNNVKVDVIYLEQERILQREENERLKNLLRERLTDLNISNGSNVHINDYLMKRPLSMRLERVRSIDLEKGKKEKSKCRSASEARRPIIDVNFTNAVRPRKLSKPKIEVIINR